MKLLVKFYDDETKRLYEENNWPVLTRGSEFSAGYDIRANMGAVLVPGETQIIHTGLAMEIVADDNLTDNGKVYEIQVRPRSGLAAKKGITVLNSPGTIDQDYRNELMVILHNSSNDTRRINTGDRIAQIVIGEVYVPQFEISDELSDTVRGENGLGSTGER